MKDELINAGFNARQKRNNQQELEFFKLWREQQQIPTNNMFAEISWEKGLSELKARSPRGSARDLGWNDF